MPHRRPTLALLLAAGLTAGASAAARATPPATAPATQPAEKSDNEKSDKPNRGSRGNRDNRDISGRDERNNDARPGPFAPEDLAAAEAFFKQHAPGRFAWYEGFVKREGEASDRVRGLRARLVARYRAMQLYRKNNPKLYDFLLQQMDLEDQVRAAARAANAAPDDPKAREKLRTAVHQLVANYLDARQARLEKLRSDLADEETELKSDRDRIDQLVDDRVKRMLKEE